MKALQNISILLLLLFSTLLAQNNKVYLGVIEGDIDLGLTPYVKRVISDAEKNNASLIIFKINTFGGRVDAATQIKDAIINSKVETVAFIDKRAISAGSLIALSCNKIVMVPGASIGATTVVDQAGEKQSEKAQSYMRSEMRSTAERTGRRTDIAEGMVDERIEIEGLVDSTQLITLTSKEAMHYGIADTILVNTQAILKFTENENAKVINLDINWGEEFIRFINNPIITSILMMIIMVGLFVEIKTPGWGIAGTASLIALALFFGSGYILEIASVMDILLFIIGVVLLLLEIFVIPGFGIFGIAGIILIVAGLFMGLVSDFPLIETNLLSMAIVQLAASFVLSTIVIYFLAKTLPKSNAFNKLILNKGITETSGYTSKKELQNLIGMNGIALTDLRPTGTAIFEDKRFDVVSQGDYILKDSKIEVIKEEGSKIVVKIIS
ncbi:MAG: ATP-dependent Clp protease proteolytic subunit [Bacteroidetes bacterium]|nr:ATP-dependent Clp protease proteolytic subunit [Bacteroidota bacterium]MBU1114071.1 ATP-dependent Clp protease proteolytic subunit [Bacteroidota bacterium]MBU1798950.1 ATP-dependent Clp protease proteolytic subunit [Bacteroidota bacterium]